jgi:ClpP class serine protease
MPKPHSLLRLTQRLYNVPHLVDKKTFSAVSAYVDSRNAGLMSFTDDDEENETVPAFDQEADLGVITIIGPLTYRSSGFEALCGGFSYEMLIEQAEEMLDNGIKTIVIDCDSGGGEAYGCFETANQLRQMCDEAGAKLYGYVDGSACSAMYGLICACDEVIANPYAEVGSIGVLIALMNDSKALEQEGYQRTFISAGDDKIPFADDGSWREGFLQDLQTKVDALYGNFVAHVSKYTGIAASDVTDTQARVFMADEALKLGLVNSIMTRSEFVSYIVNKQKGASNA